MNYESALEYIHAVQWAGHKPGLSRTRTLLAALGDRPCTLCRELTKLHEEIQRTTLSAAAAQYAEREPRGEYVLIVGGAAEPDTTAQLTPEQAAALVRRLATEGQPLSEAAKQVAKETGYRKGDLYRLALENE